MNKKFIKIFGSFEITGGALGIFSFGIHLFAYRLIDVRIQDFLLYLFILSFYAITMIGGVYLFKYKIRGYYISLLSNLIQLIGLDLFGMIFIVNSLGYFFITYVYGYGLTFDILLGGTSLIKYVPGREELKIGINVFSVAKIIILFYINIFFKEHQFQAD